MAGNRPGAKRNASTYWMSDDEWERMKEVLMCYALNIPVSLSLSAIINRERLEGLGRRTKRKCS